jgi:hypothetical protein
MAGLAGAAGLFSKNAIQRARIGASVLFQDENETVMVGRCGKKYSQTSPRRTIASEAAGRMGDEN